MDRRPLLLAVLVVLMLPSFEATAQQSSFDDEFNLGWEHNFGDVYITTAPLFHDDAMFVRTSASWGGNDGPSVSSFNLEGDLLWSFGNPNSMRHDMAPLMVVDAGNGTCGSWPNMLIVGWSDGLIEAREPTGGSVLWTHQSKAITWGISGSMEHENDRIVVPTRSGVIALCASNGAVEMEASTGLGWRNGVSVVEGEYLLGDEDGVLWAVSHSGEVRSLDLQNGKIRHAPLMTPSGLFVQSQGVNGGTVSIVNMSTLTVTARLPIGPSPAIPIAVGSTVVSADSEAIRLFDCAIECYQTDWTPFRSNGEIGAVHHGQFMLPYNDETIGWGLIRIASNGSLVLTTVNTGADGYGTSSPGYYGTSQGEYLAFGSDDGVVFVFTSASKDAQPIDGDERLEFDWMAQGIVFLLFLSLGGGAIQLLRRNHTSMLKFFSLYAVLIGLLIVDGVALQWAEMVEDLSTQPADDDGSWDPAWDESWRGTQIVSFTIDGEVRSAGGFEGYDTALELTLAACDQLGIEITSEPTGLGEYVVAFDGEEGDGWEYSVDGREPGLSSESKLLDASSRVHWYPAEAR